MDRHLYIWIRVTSSPKCHCKDLNRILRIYQHLKIDGYIAVEREFQGGYKMPKRDFPYPPKPDGKPMEEPPAKWIPLDRS
jgi:hypothetical protein